MKIVTGSAGTLLQFPVWFFFFCLFVCLSLTQLVTVCILPIAQVCGNMEHRNNTLVSPSWDFHCISTQFVVCQMILRHVSLCHTPGSNCEFLPCEANNPCENDAVCVEELDQDHFPLGFRCHCRRGFTGPRCEINVDECSSSPCFHGFCYDGKKQPILPTCFHNRQSRWKQTSIYTETHTQSLCQIRFCSLTVRQTFQLGHHCS